MPETLNLEQLAYRLVDLCEVPKAQRVALVPQLVRELLAIWNARGAADVTTVESELSSMMGAGAASPYIQNLARALHRLDQ